MAQHLGDKGADLAFIYKRRPKGTANVAEAKEVIGDVDGRLSILTDDMIDSGGTICSAADILLEQARGHRGVWAMAAHGVLSGPAIDRLEDSHISRSVLVSTMRLMRRVLQPVDGRARQHAVGGHRPHLAGAALHEQFGGGADGAGGVDHVVGEDAQAAVDVADDLGGLGDVGRCPSAGACR